VPVFSQEAVGSFPEVTYVLFPCPPGVLIIVHVTALAEFTNDNVIMIKQQQYANTLSLDFI
jgi:hypothetical protein